MKSPNWRVRPPQLRDANPLAAIATAVSQPRSHVSSSQLTWSMQQPDGRFWTITQQERPVGYATLLPLPGLPGIFELTGGIDPAYQRQGAGSFLWRQMVQDVAGTAVQQVTYTVDRLDSPAACFLQHHRFAQTHEEWTMQLDDLSASADPRIGDQLQRIGRQTAVQTLPDLYQRCFAGTPWFQPYTAAEVSATWGADDQLYYFVEDGADIGFVWLHFPTPGQAEIEPFGIVQEKQGQGYGRLLLTETLNQLHAQDSQTVTLGVWANNPAAIQLYQAFGFRQRSSSYSFTYTVPAR